MQMTEAFASAVAVTVPIFALAAGAEARGIRERLRQPDPRWEREFAAYNADHELDTSQGPAEIFAYLKGVPRLSRLYAVERAMAIAGAVVWLVVFVPRGFVKQVLAELEGAVERAGDTPAEKKPAEAADREPPQEPGQ